MGKGGENPGTRPGGVQRQYLVETTLVGGAEKMLSYMLTKRNAERRGKPVDHAN